MTVRINGEEMTKCTQRELYAGTGKVVAAYREGDAFDAFIRKTMERLDYLLSTEPGTEEAFNSATRLNEPGQRWEDDLA